MLLCATRMFRHVRLHIMVRPFCFGDVRGLHNRWILKLFVCFYVLNLPLKAALDNFVGLYNLLF